MAATYLWTVAAEVARWRRSPHNKHTVLHLDLIADMIDAATAMAVADKISGGELRTEVLRACGLIHQLVGMLRAALDTAPD